MNDPIAAGLSAAAGSPDTADFLGDPDQIGHGDTDIRCGNIRRRTAFDRTSIAASNSGVFAPSAGRDHRLAAAQGTPHRILKLIP